MKAPPFNVQFRTLSDLAVWLKANYEPACIGTNERVKSAHRRAGEVGLAQRLIATIERSEARTVEGD